MLERRSGYDFRMKPQNYGVSESPASPLLAESRSENRLEMSAGPGRVRQGVP